MSVCVSVLGEKQRSNNAPRRRLRIASENRTSKIRRKRDSEVFGCHTHGQSNDEECESSAPGENAMHAADRVGATQAQAQG